MGGPKWGFGTVRPEQGILKLRKELGLYANIRPANFASESLLKHSPLREEIAKGTNIIVLRELIGGLCERVVRKIVAILTEDFGERQEYDESEPSKPVWDTCIYTVEEVERVARVAAQIALAADPPLAVHSIDKANVLATSRMWRKVVTETMKK